MFTYTSAPHSTLLYCYFVTEFISFKLNSKKFSTGHTNKKIIILLFIMFSRILRELIEANFDENQRLILD